MSHGAARKPTSAPVKQGPSDQTDDCQARTGHALGGAQLVLPQQAARSSGGSQVTQGGRTSGRYLSRNEVAALLWAALGFNRDGTRNRFRINRHLARFILIGLYTGTRHDAILRLQWMANTTGGWFDLDAGMLYRRPQDAIETNKRRTPSPIPPRLMPHLQRWRKLSTQYVIEYDGKPIASQFRRAWAGREQWPGSVLTLRRTSSSIPARR